MARKSREVRINEAQELMNEYETAGLSSDRSFRFIQDMILRLSRGKGISKGQRKYLDDLIDQGVPTPKNEERVSEILAAAEVDGMQHVKSTLQDFAFKLGKGWDLSEKQERFLGKLLSEADKVRENGKFRPSDEVIEDLKSACAVCKAKNGWYWQHRPGTAKAFDKVSQWLDWLQCDELELPMDEPHIDQWACDKLLGAVKNQIGELKAPRFPVGSMAWTRIYAGRPNGDPRVALISGSPKIWKGEVTYPCLVDGAMMEISTRDLKKRR